MAGLADYHSLGGFQPQGNGKGLMAFRPQTQAQRLAKTFGQRPLASPGSPDSTAAGPGVVQSDYSRFGLRGPLHPSNLNQANIQKQQQLDNAAHMSDQRHEQAVAAIRAPYEQNQRTYSSMGLMTKRQLDLHSMADDISSGGPPRLRPAPGLISPSQERLLAARGQNYGPDLSVPPASHYAYEGELPNGAQSLRQYQHNATFPSSTGNGMNITATRNADGGTSLSGSPQMVNGIPVRNGVGVDPKTGQVAWAPGLFEATARQYGRDQRAKDNKLLSLVNRQGLSPNLPGVRAALERAGMSAGQKQLQQAMMQSQLAELNRVNQRRAEVGDQIHQWRLKGTTGEHSPDYVRARIDALNELLESMQRPTPSVSPPNYRQGLMQFAPRRSPNSAANLPLSDDTYPAPYGG